MHLDGQIVILGGVPIGIALVILGIATGFIELQQTGYGLAATAVVVAYMFDTAFADDPELEL